MAPPPTTLSTPSFRSTLEKLRNNDPDIQCIALIDLQKFVDRGELALDEPAEKECFAQLLGLFQKGSGEVRQMSVNALIKVTSVSQHRATVLSMMDQLLALGLAPPTKSGPANEWDTTPADTGSDLGPVAIRGVLAEIPAAHKATPELVRKVAKAIVRACAEPSSATTFIAELVDDLALLADRFATLLAADEATQRDALEMLLRLLEAPKPVARKKAIAAVGAMTPTLKEEQFAALAERCLSGLGVDDDVEMDTSASTTTAHVLLIAGLAAASPARLRPWVPRILDRLLSLTQRVDDEELIEATMTTLETLIWRAPTEVTPYVAQITTRASEMIAYDPNYAAAADDDGDDQDDDEDEGFVSDDEFDDAYSDDEDGSWKARRSSAKVIQALIDTRPELLHEFLRTLAPLLTRRLSEREESVRAEIFAAWQALLKQVKLYGPAASTDASAGGLKRKRTISGASTDGTAADVHPLQSQIPQLAAAALKQSQSKSPATQERAFLLLRAMVDAGAAIDDQARPIVDSVTKAMAASKSNASLATEVLAFLNSYISTHPARSYAPFLSKLVPIITQSIGDRLQRTSIAALEVASALAQHLASNADPEAILQLYTAVAQVLSGNTADSQTRQQALQTLGELLVHQGDHLQEQYDEAFALISSRLAQESTQTAAVQVLGRVGQSSTACPDLLLASSLEQTSALFRKSHRQTRSCALETALALERRLGDSLSDESASNLVRDLKPLLADTDLVTLSLVLQNLATIAPRSPATIQSDVLPATLALVSSSGMHGIALDSLCDFLAAIARAAPATCRSIVTQLIELALDAPDMHAAARCIGVLVPEAPDLIKEFVKQVSGKISSRHAYLSLLALGEIGRTTDLAPYNVFPHVLGYFESKSEQEKTAAAFAAGNIAVGNSALFLPTLLDGVQSGNRSTSLLYLHAIRETVTHATSNHIEAIASALWTPLMTPSSADADDGARNVKAAVLGKLSLTRPQKYISDLHSRLSTSSQSSRAVIAAAIRYALIDPSPRADAALSPVMLDFLALINDADYHVRRLAVSALNAAASHKPHLIVDALSTLLPSLYAETRVKPELVRQVKMGPWTVETDDGIANRKTAYETMFTLLQDPALVARLDLAPFIERTVAGLSDHDEIKIQAYLMIARLADVNPQQLAPVLDSMTGGIELTLKDPATVKDATGQEIQRKEEMQANALRTIIPLWHKFASEAPSSSPKFDATVRGIAAQDKWKPLFREFGVRVD